jgi:hypothetical protein
VRALQLSSENVWRQNEGVSSRGRNGLFAYEDALADEDAICDEDSIAEQDSHADENSIADEDPFDDGDFDREQYFELKELEIDTAAEQ